MTESKREEKVYIQPETLEQWVSYYRGEQVDNIFFNPILNEYNLPPDTFLVILDRTKQGKFAPEAFRGFDPEKKPDTSSAGATCCVECLKFYWVSPDFDAYESSRSTSGERFIGKFCQDCIGHV